MPRIVNCTGVPSSNRYQELPNCAERPYPEGKRVRVTEAYDFGESKMSVEPLIYQLRILLLLTLCFPMPSFAQAREGTQKTTAPTSALVTLLMDWTRGDAHYGPDFIQLHSPCQQRVEKSCECVADFKVISSGADSK